VSKPEIHYECPFCGHDSGDLRVRITHDYMPTEADHTARPKIKSLGDQLLHCICGNTYTWFSAREVAVLKGE
jgi:hypothetical protein